MWTRPACRMCWEIPVTGSDFGSYLEACRTRGCAVKVFPPVSHGALRDGKLLETRAGTIGLPRP